MLVSLSKSTLKFSAPLIELFNLTYISADCNRESKKEAENVRFKMFSLAWLGIEPKSTDSVTEALLTQKLIGPLQH